MERVIRFGRRALGWAKRRWKDLQHDKEGGQSVPPAPPPPDPLPAATTEILELFYQYVKSRPPDDYIGVHALRFHHTLVRCGTIIRNSGRLLELGGQSIIGSFARDVLGVSMIDYREDLRFPFSLPDNQFDVVLAFEVLEHIKDSPLRDTDIGWIAHFNFSGLKNVFAETFRILKPGGLLIITTPNATSVDVLFKVVSGGHPHMFEPHVRELAPAEVFKLAADHGFERVKFDTFFAWTVASEEFRQGALAYIEAAGFGTADRGDDSYFEFRKPH